MKGGVLPLRVILHIEKFVKFSEGCKLLAFLFGNLLRVFYQMHS